MNGKNLVESWDEIKANLVSFDLSIEDSLATEEFSSFAHWYYLPETGSFAPSKYIAYKSMSMGAYDGSGDVKEAVEALDHYFNKIEFGSELFFKLYYILEHAGTEKNKKVSGNIIEGGGGIYIPKKEYISTDIDELPITVISKSMMIKFEELFSEFLDSYFSEKGQWHNDFYSSCREEARKSYSEIKQAFDKGEMITDDVLLKMLPHMDHKGNREKGAWVHIAPAVSGDLKTWYQNVGWTREEDWPSIAEALFKFIIAIHELNEPLYSECRKIDESDMIKGFQTGMLTPILNALEPDRFLLVNNKSRKIINYFTKSYFSQKMGSYPQINAVGKVLIDNVSNILARAEGLEIRQYDLFDMFCHWLVSEKKFFKKSEGYYKIAPGSNAWNWENCRESGYIAIGWDELGDISGFDKDAYEKRRNEVLNEHPDWKAVGVDQVWTFAQISEGSKIIANKGTTEVLGIGEVKGEYYYVPHARHGHRLPVEWTDTSHRKIDERGWRKTLIKLSRDKFNRISEAEVIDTPESDNRAWIFQANPKYFDIKGALHELDEILWSVNQYTKQIKANDRVYLWMSGRDAGILACGKIMNNPEELDADDSEDPFILVKGKFSGKKLRVRVRIEDVLDYPILRKELKQYEPLQNLEIIRYANATNFAVTSDEEKELIRIIGLGYVPLDEKDKRASYSVDDFISETSFSRSKIERWRKILLRKKQVVVQGPPGTGKTFVAERLAKLMVSETNGFWDVVQFHPSYAYEDFIQGFRPKPSGEGGFEFELERGRFLEFCSNARRTSAPCVMIIDEINRAHLSRVFGELMYLLEYREKEISLASGGMKFKIPENVYLIGTMNTADRSIALVDHALRRRFSFIRLNPDYDVLKRHLESYGYSAESLVSVLREVNGYINDHNYEIGISFFMKNGDKLKDELPEIWASEIEPYLDEYFYDQQDKVKPFRWDTLKESKLKYWVE